jgi:hypothetical protein
MADIADRPLDLRVDIVRCHRRHDGLFDLEQLPCRVARCRAVGLLTRAFYHFKRVAVR